MSTKLKFLCFLCLIAFCAVVMMIAKFLGLNENQTHCFLFGVYMIAFGVLGLKTQSGRFAEKELAYMIIVIGALALGAIAFV